jgi:NAD(P)-dependent dehydrogenase (short-subunit alcohol dehydrogenase family)
VKAVLLGATRGMGRSLARELVRRGAEPFLLGRDSAQLARTVTDLQQEGKTDRPIGHAHCDLLEPDGFAPALDRAAEALSGFDTVVVTAGVFAAQEDLENDPERTRRLLTVDFGHTVLFCEEARRRLLARGGGTLCVFSSVAGERGRKPVVLYGAAKAGLTRYLEGLDHRYRGEGLVTICVKPGFVRTGMTSGLTPPPFAGEPDGVARQVARAIERGRPVVYTPGIWRWIMLAIRCMPRAVMRRVEF